MTSVIWHDIVRTPFVLSLLMVAVICIHAFLRWDVLPESVASNFDFHLEAQYFMPKWGVILIYIGVVILMLVIFVFSAGRIEKTMVQSERKHSKEFVARWLFYLLNAVEVFMLFVFEELFIANIVAAETNTKPTLRLRAVFGIVIFTVAAVMWSLYLHKSKPKGKKKKAA